MIIMGQMEAASEIFDYLYLGTEWNAQNSEELHNRKCVLNIILPLSILIIVLQCELYNQRHQGDQELLP